VLSLPQGVLPYPISGGRANRPMATPQGTPNGRGCLARDTARLLIFPWPDLLPCSVLMCFGWGIVLLLPPPSIPLVPPFLFFKPFLIGQHTASYFIAQHRGTMNAVFHSIGLPWPARHNVAAAFASLSNTPRKDACAKQCPPPIHLSIHPSPRPHKHPALLACPSIIILLFYPAIPLACIVMEFLRAVLKVKTDFTP